MKINQKKLDALLGKILDAHKAGTVTKSAAIGAIAHVVSAAQIGNDPELQAWIEDPVVFERWLNLAK